MSFDDGYRIDLASLSTLLSGATKLVSLASPQNPSGVAIPTKTLQSIVALMEEKCPDAYLLVDDTYRDAVYGSASVEPSAAVLGKKVICVGSLSKCHGVPGLRLGWAVTQDKELRAELVKAKFNTVISCSAVDEALALKVFEKNQQIMDERCRHLEHCVAATEQWVASNQVFIEWVRPDAGALCCVRLKKSEFDDDSVSRFYKLLARESVRVSNGAWFGDEERVFRLGFGHMSWPELEAAYEVISKVLRESLGV